LTLSRGGGILYLYRGRFLRQSLKHIRLAFKNGKFRFSVHATKEAYEERILPSEVMEALEHGEILEDYLIISGAHAV